MATLLAVALGGAIGAVARFGLAGWVQGASRGFFPWGTLAVNVLGCFLLGLLLVHLQGTVASPRIRSFLAIGVLGSFTTFSTFAWETVALVRNGEWLRAGGYLGGSVALGLVAILAGAAIATAAAGPR